MPTHTEKTEGQAGQSKSIYRMQNPWTQWTEPFRVIENVYCIGTGWVSCYIIDTPEGLILIDCAYQEVLYILLEHMHRLGLDPRNIRHLLLSHGHFDHCGAAKAIQKISGCEIWISEKDAYFFNERRDLIYFEDHVGPFRIDHYYDYASTIDFGGMSIRPVLCTGHTPGTTSFFFDVMHRGQKLTLAMHGGLGSNTLSRESLRKSGWPLSFRQEYLEMIARLMKEHVDVPLPSHAGHAKGYPFLELYKEDDGSGDCFINPREWQRMLQNKQLEVEALLQYEREHPEL